MYFKYYLGTIDKYHWFFLFSPRRNKGEGVKASGNIKSMKKPLEILNQPASLNPKSLIQHIDFHNIFTNDKAIGKM